MNESQRVFLSILQDFIKNRATERILIDESIVGYANSHQVAPILYYQVKSNLLEKAFIDHVFRSAQMKNVLNDLYQKLADHSIEYAIVKGDVIAQYYSKPLLRSMGDIDLLVKLEDKLSVDHMLAEMGAVCIRKDNRAWNYYINSIEIELHHKLLYDNEIGKKASVFFNSYENYINDHALNIDFHFLFVIAHLQKHLMGPGVGFRQFIDIAFLSLNATLDWKWIYDKACELQMVEFLKNVLECNYRWFDVDYPELLKTTIADDFFEEVTQKIFRDGVFGFGADENKTNTVVNQISKNGEIGRIKLLLKDVFLSYDKISRMPQYNYLQNNRLLLPIAWMHRISQKWNNKSIIKKRYFISDSEINRRNEYLKQWGI